MRRRAVLERLAATSDARARETTTVGALASDLEADERAVEAHLNALIACALARRDATGKVRVTITGEEFLELDFGDGVVVDAAPTDH
ncbi:hypothetical protein [Halobellus litoreus]|uniref:Transcriptional regulator n=1 Tax=Halobellus litoreus TaxID=755310 RepID=A0ABD6DRY0_9EURY|nr:hypothetical protein [Halobellus litoreus]